MMQGALFFLSAPAELREGANVAGGAGTAGDIQETTSMKLITSFDMINCIFTLCKHEYCSWLLKRYMGVVSQ